MFSQLDIARNKYSAHFITKNIAESEESLLGLGLVQPNIREWFQYESIPFKLEERDNRT